MGHCINTRCGCQSLGSVHHHIAQILNVLLFAVSTGITTLAGVTTHAVTLGIATTTAGVRTAHAVHHSVIVRAVVRATIGATTTHITVTTTAMATMKRVWLRPTGIPREEASCG